MLAFSAVQLINILSVAGIIDNNALESIAKCRHLLNAELISIKDGAKKLAQHLFKKQCVSYTESDLEFVAIRARQKINESPRRIAWKQLRPEMNNARLDARGAENNDSEAEYR